MFTTTGYTPRFCCAPGSRPPLGHIPPAIWTEIVATMGYYWWGWLRLRGTHVLHTTLDMICFYVCIYIYILYIWLYIYDYIFNIRSNHLRTHLRWSVPSWLVDPTWRFLKIGVPPDRKFDEFRKPWSWGSPILTLAFVTSIRSVQLPILFWLPLWNRPSSQGTNPHSGSKARLITMFDDKIHHFSWFLGTSFPPFPHRIFFQTNAFFGAVGSARRLLTWDWHGLTPHRLCLAWHPQNV